MYIYIVFHFGSRHICLSDLFIGRPLHACMVAFSQARYIRAAVLLELDLCLAGFSSLVVDVYFTRDVIAVGDVWQRSGGVSGSGGEE